MHPVTLCVTHAQGSSPASTAEREASLAAFPYGLESIHDRSHALRGHASRDALQDSSLASTAERGASLAVFSRRAWERCAQTKNGLYL